MQGFGYARRIARRGAALALGIVVAFASVALAGTELETADVGIVGDAGVSPAGATLVRDGSTTFDVTIVANDGSFPERQCDEADASAAPTYTVSGTGLAASGVYDAISFVCPWQKNDGAQSITFADRTLTAAVTAPLGRSDHGITIGDVGSMVVLGRQVDLADEFVFPRIYLTVNPRPVSGLSASAAGTDQIDLTWTASDDAADITDHVVYRDGVALAVHPAKDATSFSDTGLDADTEYCYTIKTRYVDGDGNEFYSAASNESCATTDALSSSYTIAGFYRPVDMGGVWNTVKGGSTVPLKWEMFDSATELTDVSYVGSIVAEPVACQGGTADAVEVTATGGTSLRYDPVAGQYVYNWQTPRKPGACYEITMTATDGSSISALFKLK